MVGSTLKMMSQNWARSGTWYRGAFEKRGTVSSIADASDCPVVDQRLGELELGDKGDDRGLNRGSMRDSADDLIQSVHPAVIVTDAGGVGGRKSSGRAHVQLASMTWEPMSN